jgi:hypothetical protein
MNFLSLTKVSNTICMNGKLLHYGTFDSCTCML